MSNIEIQNGSEGPRHDPYGYTEITVTRNDGDVVTIHEGLAEWVEVNGVKHDFDHDLCLDVFESVAGISRRTAQRVYDRLRSTCGNCGCRYFRTRAGYPGETFHMCVRCDNVVHVDFDESAII